MVEPLGHVNKTTYVSDTTKSTTTPKYLEEVDTLDELEVETLK